MDKAYLYAHPATEELARRFAWLGEEFYRTLPEDRRLYDFMRIGSMRQLLFMNLLPLEEALPGFIEFLRVSIPTKEAYRKQLETAQRALKEFLSTRNKSAMRSIDAILECARSWEAPFEDIRDRQALEHLYGLYVTTPSATNGASLLKAGEVLYHKLKQEATETGFTDGREFRVQLDALEIALLLSGDLTQETS